MGKCEHEKVGECGDHNQEQLNRIERKLDKLLGRVTDREMVDKLCDCVSDKELVETVLGYGEKPGEHDKTTPGPNNQTELDAQRKNRNIKKDKIAMVMNGFKQGGNDE